MEIEVVSAQVNKTDQDEDDGTVGTAVRHSMWYLQSKTLGKISVGHTSHAADDITSSICLGGVCGTASQGNIDGAPGMGLFFHSAGGNDYTLANLFAVGDVDRGNIIRYDTPSIAGFVLSADWGEDDMWSVALRYAGEFNGVKIAAAVGYFEDHDCNGANGKKCGADSGDRLYGDYNEIRASGAIIHTPDGPLFAEGGYVSSRIR
jgi:predicted porin